jgi:hypothetical protein
MTGFAAPDATRSTLFRLPPAAGMAPWTIEAGPSAASSVLKDVL